MTIETRNIMLNAAIRVHPELKPGDYVQLSIRNTGVGMTDEVKSRIVVRPKMNGKQLAEELRRLYPQLKVLFISGYTDDAIVHDGVLDSGIAFLQKPFLSFTLARKVREVLDEPKK